jgi:hypothetical protein
MNNQLTGFLRRNAEANNELQASINAARFITPIDNTKASRERANQRLEIYKNIGYPLDYDRDEKKLCFGCTAVAIIITAAIVLHVFASI